MDLITIFPGEDSNLVRTHDQLEDQMENENENIYVNDGDEDDSNVDSDVEDSDQSLMANGTIDASGDEDGEYEIISSAYCLNFIPRFQEAF